VAAVAPNFLTANQILNDVPIWPLIVNIFSACFCMGCSAIYHLLYAKNEAFQTNLSRLDYAGISVLVFGSAYPVIHYCMACDQTQRECRIVTPNFNFSVPVAKSIYTGVQATMCFACFVITLIPKFDKPEYQKVRGIMYIILGLSTSTMFIMFTYMDPYITPHRSWVYALGGYIYI